MRQFLITVGAVLTGFLIVLLFLPAILVGMAASLFAPEVEPLPEKIVLEVNLNQSLVEEPPRFRRFGLGAGQISTLDLIAAFERAAADRRVAGIYLKAGLGGLGPAAAQDVRDALAALDDTGKFKIAYTQSLNSPGLGDYYAISSADEIWMQRNGIFLPAGVGLVSTFVKGTLDKLGIEPQFAQFYEYKNLANMFTEEGFTEAHREATEAIATSVYNHTVQDIADDRRLPFEEIRIALNESPQMAADAETRGLVDKLGYEHEARTYALETAGDDAEFVDLLDYLARSQDDVSSEGERIAVIIGEGPIVEGEDAGGNPFSDNVIMAGDSVAAAIREAAEDDEVRAILFRVESGGGSAIASDQIWHEIKRARDTGKPVVVSMGDVAASGGYYVAMGADHIVAQPATLTGSIGVVGGKLVVTGLLEKLGITTETVSAGENALIFSAQTPFSEEQWMKYRASLKAVYDDFTSKAAEDRDMPLEQLDLVARGRVWTGADALQRGLVDELGGLRTAVAKAKDLAGIGANEPVQLKQYPQPKGFAEELFGVAGDLESAGEAMALIAYLAETGGIKALLELNTAHDTGELRSEPLKLQ